VAPSDLPTNDSASAGNNEVIGLTIPRGKAIARPATRLTDEEDEKIERKNYGGRGDRVDRVVIFRGLAFYLFSSHLYPPPKEVLLNLIRWEYHLLYGNI
jgi:hypothetical protein